MDTTKKTSSQEIPTISKKIEDSTKDEDQSVVIQVEDQTETEECPVCLEEMTSDRTILEPCKHQFCPRCIKTIVEGLGLAEKLKCPYCRQTVEIKVTVPSLRTIQNTWTQERNHFHMVLKPLLIFCCICAIIGLLVYRYTK